MKSRKRRPRYAVNVAIKAYDLSKAGTAVTLTIREDAHAEPALLGTVEIGQGTFGWRSVNSKRFQAHRLAHLRSVAERAPVAFVLVTVSPANGERLT